MNDADNGRAVQRILIIDDEPTVRRALARAAHASAVVREAGSVAEARRILRDHGPFDVVLCDVNLPDGLGWDVASDALATRAKVVMISGTDRRPPPHFGDMALRLVRKPFSPRTLMHELGLGEKPPSWPALQSAVLADPT